MAKKDAHILIIINFKQLHSNNQNTDGSMNKKKDLLTPLELKVMNILWKLNEAFVKDLLACWPDAKKPHANTVSTTVRILEDKKYVSHKTYGRSHQYYPLISKTQYQKRLLGNIVENAFAGSASSLVSALIDTEKVSNSELDEIQTMINKLKD